MTTDEHEHQFPESLLDGTPVLYPCLLCGLSAFDAIAAMKTERDATCEHGTALDVHCCNCHSGFIFDAEHECPDPVPDVMPGEVSCPTCGYTTNLRSEVRAHNKIHATPDPKDLEIDRLRQEVTRLTAQLTDPCYCCRGDRPPHGGHPAFCQAGCRCYGRCSDPACCEPESAPAASMTLEKDA